MDESRLRSFLENEPLNEELARLRAGDLADHPEITIESIARGPEDEPLDRFDLKALRKLRTGEEWPALAKVARKCIRSREQYATVLSQDDPLGKANEVAQAWAYAKIAREIWQELSQAVYEETIKLERENKDARLLDTDEAERKAD